MPRDRVSTSCGSMSMSLPSRRIRLAARTQRTCSESTSCTRKPAPRSASRTVPSISSTSSPCCAAASSPAAQTSMSARARRASACAKRPNRYAYASALYPMCRGSRTGTSRGCTGFAHGVGLRWPWHGATGTESEIWRVGNQHGTCARRMVALDRLPSGLSSQQGHVRQEAPPVYSRVHRDFD